MNVSEGEKVRITFDAIVNQYFDYLLSKHGDNIKSVMVFQILDKLREKKDDQGNIIKTNCVFHRYDDTSMFWKYNAQSNERFQTLLASYNSQAHFLVAVSFPTNHQESLIDFNFCAMRLYDKSTKTQLII